MAYVPRAASPLPLWESGGVNLKPTLLRAAGRGMPTPTRLGQAQATAARALADEGVAGGSLGFAILHLGADADWLLVDWWVNGAALAQRLFAGTVAGGPFLPVAPRPLVACVWELAVIAHERAAWIAAMMDGDAGGGSEHGRGAAAYLADRLPEGMC